MNTTAINIILIPFETLKESRDLNVKFFVCVFLTANHLEKMAYKMQRKKFKRDRSLNLTVLIRMIRKLGEVR